MELGGLNMDFNFDNDQKEFVPPYLIEEIDNAITQDFDEVLPISDEDRQNEMYKAMRFSLKAAHSEIVYERKVITVGKEPVIPREQYLIGVRPTDGLCIFTQKQSHKEMLCDGPIRELAKQCILTQSLQYILVESKSFKVWSYIPVCCSNDTCPFKVRPLDMRRNLFSK